MAITANDSRVISRNNPAETSRPWTSKEIVELRRLAPMGAETAAAVLNRSVASVKMQAYRLRLSLRPPGERGGLVLGQPRGTSFVADPKYRAIRDEVLAGHVDIERMNRRTPIGPLCPACAIRPQEVEASGLCEDCHLKRLAEAHALEPGREEAQRALDRERQRKHRRRKASEEEVAP